MALSSDLLSIYESLFSTIDHTDDFGVGALDVLTAGDTQTVTGTDIGTVTGMATGTVILTLSGTLLILTATMAFHTTTQHIGASTTTTFTTTTITIPRILRKIIIITQTTITLTDTGMSLPAQAKILLLPDVETLIQIKIHHKTPLSIALKTSAVLTCQLTAAGKTSTKQTTNSNIPHNAHALINVATGIHAKTAPIHT